MTIRIGAQVREAGTDPTWQMHPGETGEIVRRADDEMGLPGCGRFWVVRFSGAEMVFLDTDLVVV